jgi:4-amino-4-deoxy-L-arabinose transferase-like glycosyltransferase
MDIPPLLIHRLALGLIFAAGLGLHLTVFEGRHREGDEVIYQTLVQQLAEGHGYTLQGTRLLTQHLVGEQYDRPLFHHPPLGVALFWLFRALFGELGFALAQLASYTLFFFSLMAIVDALELEPRLPCALLTAALAATTPIMSHVLTRYWLDGPLLAFVTLGAALFTWSVRRDSTRLALAAGLGFGASSLIKATAFLALPGVFALAWAMHGALSLRRFSLLLAIASALMLLVHAPWLVWRAALLGSPLAALRAHADAGLPAQALLASNSYVKFVTVTRPAWCYFTLLPRVCWTLVPCLALSALAWRRRDDVATRLILIALWLWIASLVGVHVALGFLGYSKLLRYLVLATPAIVLLPVVLASRLRLQQSPALLALLALGVGLEIAQGVCVALATQAPLIMPWFGGLTF